MRDVKGPDMGWTLSRRRFVELGLISAAAAACGAPPGGGGRVANTMVKIIRRAQWGAVDPDLGASNERGLFDSDSNPGGWLVYSEPLPEVLNTVVIHHSALPLSDGPREIQLLHMHTRGFADIAYHFVIDETGQLYEGRLIGARGAHTRGANTGTVGVVLMGNFELAEPPASQLATVRHLVSILKDKYTLSHLAGHRDFQPDETVCPGRHLAPLLPGLADAVGLAFGTGGYVPPSWAGRTS